MIAVIIDLGLNLVAYREQCNNVISNDASDVGPVYIVKNVGQRGQLTGSLSPVIDDSSIVNEWPEMRRPSAGTCRGTKREELLASD